MNDFGKFISARQEHISKKVRVPWNQEKETLGDYLKKVVQVRGVEMVKIGQEMTTADREFLSANLTPWTNLLERQHKLEKQLLAWLEKPK